MRRKPAGSALSFHVRVVYCGSKLNQLLCSTNCPQMCNPPCSPVGPIGEQSLWRCLRSFSLFGCLALGDASLLGHTNHSEKEANYPIPSVTNWGMGSCTSQKLGRGGAVLPSADSCLNNKGWRDAKGMTAAAAARPIAVFLPFWDVSTRQMLASNSNWVCLLFRRGPPCVTRLTGKPRCPPLGLWSHSSERSSEECDHSPDGRRGDSPVSLVTHHTGIMVPAGERRQTQFELEASICRVEAPKKGKKTGDDPAAAAVAAAAVIPFDLSSLCCLSTESAEGRLGVFSCTRPTHFWLVQLPIPHSVTLGYRVVGFFFTVVRVLSQQRSCQEPNNQTEREKERESHRHPLRRQRHRDCPTMGPTGEQGGLHICGQLVEHNRID